jgi:TatD DNase family protein
MNVADAHVHLDLLPDAPRALEEARSRGVEKVLCVSMGLSSIQFTLEMSGLYTGYVLPAIGLHPWQIDREDVGRALEEMAASLDRTLAIGEIGLDYGIRTRKSVQKEVLQRQLEMAAERDLPVVLHCRHSHARTLDLLREFGIRRAVFHWYSGPLDVLETLLAEGYLISVTPAVESSPKHRDAVRAAPLDRILLETDSPVLYQGKEATPADVVRVCFEVARLKQVEPEELATRTNQTFREFLRLPPDGSGQGKPHGDRHSGARAVGL